MTEQLAVLAIAGPDVVRRRAKGLLREFRGRLALIVTVNAVAVVCGLAPPALLGYLIDRIVAGRPVSVVAVIAVIAVTLLLSAGLAFAANNWAFTLGERVFSILRMDFASGLLTMPPPQVEAVDPGEVLSRSTSDMDAVSDIVRTGVPEVLIGAVSVVITIGFAFVIDPLVALGCLVGLPFIIISTRWYVRYATKAYADKLSTQAAAASSISETVRGYEVIESHDLGTVREATIRRSIARSLDAASVPLRLEQRWFPAVQLGYSLPVLAILAWGAYLVRADLSTVGSVAGIALYMSSILTPLDDLIYWFGESQAATAAMGRILGVATSSRTDDPPAQTTTAPSGDSAITLRDVHFAYGAAGDAISGIDLSVRRGERVCVVGPSGAGKTTLAMVIAGVTAPRTGSVEVAGRPLLLAQEDHIFYGTVRDNLLLAKPTASDDELWAGLKLAGARDWVHSLEDVLDTNLGVDAYAPTPTQARQLSLARLFIHEPEVLILDEATAGLTDDESQRFETALATALPESTVLQVAHDLWAAEFADQVIVMEDGRICESGPHDELLTRDGVYAGLYRAWRSTGTHGSPR